MGQINVVVVVVVVVADCIRGMEKVCARGRLSNDASLSPPQGNQSY